MSWLTGKQAARKKLDRILDFVSHRIGLAFALVSFTCIPVFLAFLFILEMPTNIARSFQSLSDVSQREFGIPYSSVPGVITGFLNLISTFGRFGSYFVNNLCNLITLHLQNWDAD
jgi:hypothetical protein